MKIHLRFWIALSVLLVGCPVNAQSWQWGKRGGSTNNLQTNSTRPEEVTGLLTDSQKNIYLISPVGKDNLNIDGHPKTNYSDNTTLMDYAIASFGCDGSYRWSKIIGGADYETLHPPALDASDNLYAAGQFGDISDAFIQQHIDTDYTFPGVPEDNRRLILMKFGSDGTLLWWRKPEATTITTTLSYNASSLGFAGDSQGNCYWLVQIPPGTYADGAFTNTATGSNLFMFIYDADGSFISATAVDMQVVGFFKNHLQMFRNPYNGYFYFSSYNGNDLDEATVGGQTVSHSAFMACFNDQMQFQWLRENTSTLYGIMIWYNMVFDSDNNIFVSMKITGTFDSFLGFSVPTLVATSSILKLTPQADAVQWSTYYNHNGALKGAIALNDDEVGFAGCCFSNNFTWGSQSIFASNPNEGSEVLLARFNAADGNCTSLKKIPGDVGYDDTGTALAVDASGDYIVGGNFGHYLTFDNDAQVLNPGGAQTDFFVAKFATQACSPLAVDDQATQNFTVWPNPFSETININSENNGAYSIYDVRGVLLTSGKIEPGNNTLDSTSLSAGLYMLKMDCANGETKTVKLVRE